MLAWRGRRALPLDRLKVGRQALRVTLPDFFSSRRFCFALRGFARVLARVADFGQLMQKRFSFGGRQAGEHFGLKMHGDEAGGLVFTAARRMDLEGVCAPIAFVRFAFDEPAFLQTADQGRDCVRVAGHESGQFALGNPVVLQERAQGGKLVGSDSQMRDAPSESLIEPVPGAAQKHRKPPSFGSINGQP